MQVTYRDLLDGAQAVSQLMSLSPAPIAKVSAKLARNARKLQREIETFNEVKGKLLKPFADDEGKVSLPDTDEGKAVEKEYQQLLDSQVEVDVHPLTMEELAECEQAKPDFNVTPALMYQAWFMFEGVGD